MVKHIVLWKLKEQAEGCTKEENAQSIKSMVEALKQSIPQVIHIEVGINFDKSDAAYDVALYSEFKTKEDLQAYQVHPEHQKVAAYIAKVREQRVVVDYTIKE